MTVEDSKEFGFWRRARWGLALALVLAVQLGFIHALSDRSSILTGAATPSPAILMTSGKPNELLLLSDPTLFVLPHQQGYSGETWLKIRPYKSSPFLWTETQEWLCLEAENLGAAFNDFVGTNSFASARFEMMPSPELTRLDVESEIVIAGKSSVHLDRSLTERGLRTPMEVPPWPYTDVIPPSKVQVLVDAAGNVISALSLPTDNPVESSTRLNSDADQNAARLARTAHFQPLPKGGSDVTLGVMVFDWQINSQQTNTNLGR